MPALLRWALPAAAIIGGEGYFLLRRPTVTLRCRPQAR